MPLDEKVLAGRAVRLFSCHHIRSEREAEVRATASFLAVARAVTPFGRAVVSMAGGPGGRLACFTEVPFKVTTGAASHEERPDGVIRVTRGQTEWVAFVEAKIGGSPLEQEQVDRYHALARDLGIDVLITISNQAALADGLPPGLAVDGRRLRSVPIVHLSWERLLSEAQLLSRQDAVRDSDQQWMLDEWIRYVADEGSRIIEPPQLGDQWSEVLRAAREGSLAAYERQIRDVVQHWDGFLHKLSFRLRARLGVEVQVKQSRAERRDPSLRLPNLQGIALREGELPGTFQIPDAAGDLSVSMFPARRAVQYSIEVEAPTEGRAKTRIRWLLRQLTSKELPEKLIVRVHWEGRRVWSEARVSEVDEGMEPLLRTPSGEPIAAGTMPRAFTLEWTATLPKGKGRSTVPVLEGIATGVVAFYRSVVADIRPYVPKAPALQEESVQPERAGESDPVPPSTGGSTQRDPRATAVDKTDPSGGGGVTGAA